jgi:hypothetical protein
MYKNHSNENLQKVSFKNHDLANAAFVNSDLRGTDFSGANLTGADFTNVRTGITPVNTALLFCAALIISLISGYMSMLAGQTIHKMIDSDESNTKYAGIIALILTLVFILYFYLKGGSIAIRNLILPVTLIALIVGAVSYLSGVGTGKGMLYLVVANILVVVMFVIGTAARAAAGTLSSTLIFIAVALAGGMFGKSVGGGIGSLIMAVSCALISKKALKGVKGFETLQKVAGYITSKFGTSFRSAQLSNAIFSGSKIRNADFSNADLSLVYWGDAKKSNCIINN